MCYKNEYQKRAHGEVEQIFRELLPKAGLHVREEQIRLCHEMLDALMKNEITLCDAGVGIGKTYAYLTACILMRKYIVLHSGFLFDSLLQHFRIRIPISQQSAIQYNSAVIAECMYPRQEFYLFWF